MTPERATIELFEAMRDAGLFGRKRQSVEDAAHRLAAAVRDAANPAPAGLDVEQLLDRLANVALNATGRKIIAEFIAKERAALAAEGSGE